MNCRRIETLMESPPPKDKFQRLARSLVPALVFVPGACLACWSILFVEGWPQNHEFLSSFERAEAFRQAFKEEDFFPLWSPLGFYGYGSPLPFFYHRLHSTFVALLSFVTGSVYWALKLSIPILLVVGALGIERLARCLAISSPFRLAAGVLLLFSSYTLTDWLIRGAMAEFTASMLLPWLFYYGLLVIRESRGRTGLGITLVLLFYSHSVIFFYSMFFLMFLAFSWALDQRSDSKGTMVGLLRLFFVPLVIVLTLCGPYALSVVLLAKWFNIRSLQEGYYVPTKQFRPFLRYLYDINFSWGAGWGGYSVELGRAPLFALCILASAGVKKRINLEIKRVLPLVFSGLFFLYLQTPISRTFYLYFPGASFIQFPWRLLAFLTPILIILTVYIADKCFLTSRALVTSVISIALIYQSVFGIRAQVIRYDRFSRTLIEERLGLVELKFFEFLPRDFTQAITPPRRKLLQIANCEVVSQTPERDLTQTFHFRRIELELIARDSCTVYLNQFATPFISTEIDGGGNVERASDGTIVVRLAPGDTRRVTFRVRGLFESLLYGLGAYTYSSS